MDVDKLQGGNSNSNGKSVSLFPSGGSGETMVFAVTPINPNPTTPRAKEIVEKIRSYSPGLLAAATGAGDQVLHATPSHGTEFFSGRAPESPGPVVNRPAAVLPSPPHGADCTPGRAPASPRPHRVRSPMGSSPGRQEAVSLPTLSPGGGPPTCSAQDRSTPCSQTRTAVPAGLVENGVGQVGMPSSVSPTAA
jgi:hypothetical protein